MKQLLDTHSFIWFVTGNSQITSKVRSQIENNDNLLSIANLPLHHRDPFDKLIIAQAMVERIPIVVADKAFDSYPIERIW